MQNSEIIGWSCIIFYLLGYILSFRMFLKMKDHLVDGWGLVFLAFYFSILSWFSLLIFICFKTKAKPPKWLMGK
jgi:hypothetical protein